MKKQKHIVSVSTASEMTGINRDFIYKAIMNEYLVGYQEADALPEDRQPKTKGRNTMKYVDVIELQDYKRTIERLKILNPIHHDWTTKEEQIIRDGLRSGKSVEIISREIPNRTFRAVQERLRKMRKNNDV